MSLGSFRSKSLQTFSPINQFTSYASAIQTPVPADSPTHYGFLPSTQLFLLQFVILCHPPTLAPEPAHSCVSPYAAVQAPVLVSSPPLSQWCQAQGTAQGTTTYRDVCATSGWLLAQHPGDFLAGRLKLLGTELHASIATMVRAASGWLSARPSSSLQTMKPDPTAKAGGVSSYHAPVFPAEVIEWMQPAEGSFIIDGTLGGGGHSELFLKAGARVLGVDRDPEALAHASQRLAAFGDRFCSWEGNFSDVADDPKIGMADGLLLDLGVSSRQLDCAERGFSFMRDGPLDMRMGPSCPHDAAEVVNEWPEHELIRILREYGEEKKAHRIAAAITERRADKRFTTTLDLASCIEKAVGRQGRIHPATRAFQAIRMAVNEELESLQRTLEAVPGLLKPGGRLLIITFHSLEDRMVKHFLKRRSTEWIDSPAWPQPRRNPEHHFKLLARRAIAPTEAEVNANPRARSAKLRVASLLEHQTS